MTVIARDPSAARPGCRSPVVGDWLDQGAVVPHDKQLTVGLRRIRRRALVLEPQARAGKDATVGRLAVKVLNLPAKCS